MRRKSGIALGACAALVLAGVAGVTALSTANGPVGTWHEAPAVTRTQVAAEQERLAGTPTSAAPQAAAGRAVTPSATAGQAATAGEAATTGKAGKTGHGP